MYLPRTGDSLGCADIGVFGAMMGLASISTGAGGPTFAEGYTGLPSTSAGPVGGGAAGVGAGLSYLVARNAFAESSLAS